MAYIVSVCSIIPIKNKQNNVIQIMMYLFQNIERVVLPHLGVYWPFLMSGLHKCGPQTSQLQQSASMVYGAFLVRMFIEI